MGNICSSASPFMDTPEESQPIPRPPSPSWKLPPYPAPALPPLTRNNKVIIACSKYLDDEDEKARTKRHVLNGQGEALSIVFDDPDNLELFIPEVKKLFSLTLTLSSLELHTANLDVEIDFLQTFLDTLPSHGEMKAFSLVTARDCPLVFSAISGLLYRNPALQALRLWGADLTMAGSENQFYPTCKLIRVDLSHCKLFPQQVDNLLGGSKDSLLCLKFENNIGLSGTHISRAVNNFGKTVQMLTILLPAESDNEMDLKASYLVADTSSRFPSTLKYLHCAGLAASDKLFAVTPSTEGVKKGQPPKTHLSSLVALRIEDCPRVTVNGLFAAIRQKSLPNLLRLHVFWTENEDVAVDVELWKTFAASEEIRISLEQEGLVHITALKESAGTGYSDPSDPSQAMQMPVLPAAVAQVDPRTVPKAQELLRPTGHPYRQQPYRRDRSRQSSRRGHRRYREESDSEDDYDSSEDSDSESGDSASESDDSDDYQSSYTKQRRPSPKSRDRYAYGRSDARSIRSGRSAYRRYDGSRR